MMPIQIKKMQEKIQAVAVTALAPGELEGGRRYGSQGYIRLIWPDMTPEIHVYQVMSNMLLPPSS